MGAGVGVGVDDNGFEAGTLGPPKSNPSKESDKLATEPLPFWDCCVPKIAVLWEFDVWLKPWPGELRLLLITVPAE